MALVNGFALHVFTSLLNAEALLWREWPRDRVAVCCTSAPLHGWCMVMLSLAPDFIFISSPSGRFDQSIRIQAFYSL